MVSTQEPISTTGLTGSVNQTAININREFHTEESSTYWLPKDDDEQKRLVGVSELYDTCYPCLLILPSG